MCFKETVNMKRPHKIFPVQITAALCSLWLILMTITRSEIQEPVLISELLLKGQPTSFLMKDMR